MPDWEDEDEYNEKDLASEDIDEDLEVDDLDAEN